MHYGLGKAQFGQNRSVKAGRNRLLVRMQAVPDDKEMVEPEKSKPDFESFGFKESGTSESRAGAAEDASDQAKEYT